MMSAAAPHGYGGRTRIKVCGVTCFEDAQEAVACGTDALGFIFVPGTPRYMGDRMAEVERIVTRLEPFVTAVAVVRDLSDARMLPPGLFGTVQYYTASASDVELPAGIRRVLALRGVPSVHSGVAIAGVAAVVVDAYDPDRLGGTGSVTDWTAARRLRDMLAVPLILAGGLTAGNVAEAIMSVRPYAVDVSSGVESEPGRKDPEKLRRFVSAVRLADEALWTALQAAEAV